LGRRPQLRTLRCVTGAARLSRWGLPVRTRLHQQVGAPEAQLPPWWPHTADKLMRRADGSPPRARARCWPLSHARSRGHTKPAEQGLLLLTRRCVRLNHPVVRGRCPANTRASPRGKCPMRDHRPPAYRALIVTTQVLAAEVRPCAAKIQSRIGAAGLDHDRREGRGRPSGGRREPSPGPLLKPPARVDRDRLASLTNTASLLIVRASCTFGGTPLFLALSARCRLRSNAIFRDSAYVLIIIVNPPKLSRRQHQHQPAPARHPME
jgi:hypothetical protein